MTQSHPSLACGHRRVAPRSSKLDSTVVSCRRVAAACALRVQHSCGHSPVAYHVDGLEALVSRKLDDVLQPTARTRGQCETVLAAQAACCGRCLLLLALRTCPTALVAPFCTTTSPGCSSTKLSSMHSAVGGLQRQHSVISSSNSSKATTATGAAQHAGNLCCSALT